MTSQLLAAFGGTPTDQNQDGDQDPDAQPLRLTLIPSGYSDGAYSVIGQLAVPGSELTTATWDMGASVVSRRAVDGTSNRITVATRGAPVISQRAMTFSPVPFEVVAVAQVDYIESEDDYVQIHTQGRKLRKKQTLSELEELLPTGRFVRIHRCYLLNVDRLPRVEPYAKDSRVAVLTDGTRLPVSRSGYGRLRELL